MSFLRLFSVAVIFAVCFGPTAAHAKIDPPVRGKKYTLSPENGPWMIMVTSFTLPPGVESADELPGAMTPEQAADELVYELRSQGVPAYTYTMGEKTESIQTTDRLADPVTRSYTSQHLSVCVLAGNYQTVDPEQRDSKVAIQTLKWVKNFHPKVISTEKEQAFVTFDYTGMSRNLRGRASPLRGAFFTTNPLRNNENHAAESERSKLLHQLNADSDVCLYRNNGKYTLVVATYMGQRMMAGDKSRAAMRFNESFGENLDKAANDAWELASYMRQLKLDAYVWHDESCSVVTVGSFDSLDDPRIEKAKETYRAKITPDVKTGKEILMAQHLTYPVKPKTVDEVQRQWVFDPKPQLMKVPE